jgi:hypothetical protein
MALKIDTEIVKTAMTEVLMQNINNFNAGTNGAISLSSHYIMGDSADYSKLAEIANLVGRRDIAADTDATVKSLNSADSKSVICYFSTGSIEFKKVDARRYGSDVNAFSMAIGEQIGVGFMNYMLNRGIFAVRAAIEANKATLAAGDGTGTATYTLLNTGLSKFGDASGSIVAWVMNGKVFHDIVGDGLANVHTDNVAGNIIATGTTATLGRPAFVTDADGLTMKDISTGLVDTTSILGLTANALEIAETEAREIFSETVGGKENLKLRVQGESDVLVTVKGYSYAGTDNPTDAVLGLASNWTQSATDVKSTAGVLINVL